MNELEKMQQQMKIELNELEALRVELVKSATKAAKTASRLCDDVSDAAGCDAAASLLETANLVFTAAASELNARARTLMQDQVLRDLQKRFPDAGGFAKGGFDAKAG